MNCTLSSTDLAIAARLFRRLRFGTTLPILDQILVTVTGSDATLATTNLDTAIVLRLPLAGPSTDGSFTLPRCELFTLAKQAKKNTPVTFETGAGAKGGTLARFQTKSFASNREFAPLKPEDFPPVDFPTDHSCILPTATLNAVRLARPAAGTDETRYVLNGVHFDSRDGGSVVATDGRRMVMTPARVPHHDAIIPNAVADLLVDPECTGPAVWRRDDEKALDASLTFANGRAVILFTLIEGNYPNWRQVIPDPTSRRASFTFTPGIAASFVDWLRGAPKETIRLEPQENALVCTRVSDKGESRASITVPALITGTPPGEIAFNSRHLAEAVSMGLHTIDIIDEITPAVGTNGNTRCIILPMRRPADVPTSDADPSDQPDPADESDSSEEE